jgi:hypothetical protein
VPVAAVHKIGALLEEEIESTGDEMLAKPSQIIPAKLINRDDHDQGGRRRRIRSRRQIGSRSGCERTRQNGGERGDQAEER